VGLVEMFSFSNLLIVSVLLVGTNMNSRKEKAKVATRDLGHVAEAVRIELIVIKNRIDSSFDLENCAVQVTGIHNTSLCHLDLDCVLVQQCSDTRVRHVYEAWRVGWRGKIMSYLRFTSRSNWLRERANSPEERSITFLPVSNGPTASGILCELFLDAAKANFGEG
jgi:hypothetical protein